MKIKRKSAFKSPDADYLWFRNWVQKLEAANVRKYISIEVPTSLGKTQVWHLETGPEPTQTLVIFPGARTTSLIWDLDRGLDHLGMALRIYLVETNGLPNLSDGATPDIKGLGYGVWAGEVIKSLELDQVYVAGASFGGLICMKLALVHPELIKAAFLLNPGCLQPFSLQWKNLYYNLLPILAPTVKNVTSFLDKAVFCKPNHKLSVLAEKMLIDYEVFAISRYKDSTQKPYYMGDQLTGVSVPTYLFEGDKDLLFPYERSIAHARKLIHSLREVKVYPDVGHGIEVYPKAIGDLGQLIRNFA